MNTNDAERITNVEQGLILGNLRGSDERHTLAEEMARYTVPGISVAVLESGTLAWARGYGARDATKGDNVGVDTVFQAASISKPTTALGVMRLVERGDVDLDRDVNEYLTSWQAPPRGAWQPRLTLRQLLSHSAGLTVHGFPGYAADAPTPTLRQVLDGVAPANSPAVRVDILPGLHFRYSGGGTSIVQQVLEDVTGEPFPTFMQREVLTPLGMTRSGYLQPLPEERWSDAATAHHAGAAPARGRAHTYPELAAAGLWTTATDLMRMFSAVQSAWVGQSGGFLRPATAREMLTPQVPGDSQIGIGFFLEGEGASRRFYHTGGNHGFTCVALAYCESGHGAAIMTNSEEGPYLFDELLASIAREYEWVGFLPADPISDPDQSNWTKYIGDYVLATGARYSVRVDDGTLLLSSPGQTALRLAPLTESHFVALPLAVEIAFEHDGLSEATALTITQNKRGERAIRQR